MPQLILSRCTLAFCSLGLVSSVVMAQGWQSRDEGVIPVPPTAEKAVLVDPGAGLRATLTRLDAVDWVGWQQLDQLLTDVHRRTGIPALAAAFVRDGEIVVQAAVGVQEFGSTEKISGGDRFHLGSITKSFTATLIGRLVEQGVLSWSTTVGAALPDVAMHPAYRPVTLEQLLGHRGGLPAYTHGPPPGRPEFVVPVAEPTAMRAAFLAHVLAFPPVATPGGSSLYSNVGYALAGHIAERMAGQGWEELMRGLVLEPLGMGSAGTGFPRRPSGHVGNGPEFDVVPLEAYPPIEHIAPAGNLHCSIADLGRYAIAHLAGLGEQDGILRWETVQRLHTVGAQDTGMHYASGWFVTASELGDAVHAHGGTIGTSFARIELYPARGEGVVFATTVGQGLGEAVAARITRALLARHGRRPAELATAESSAPRAQPAADGEQDAEFWRVIEAMSNAINNEDREAFHALFAASHPRDDRDSVFDFMAGSVLPARGGIRCFHAVQSLTHVTDSARPIRAVTFHLENGFPGYIAVSLDEAGKVVDFSLFVKGDLCRNGPDRQCDRVVRQLQGGI